MRNRYRRIVEAVFGSYWAIMPEKLEAIVAFLELQAKGVKFTPEEIAARIGAKKEAAARAGGNGSAANAVGVIPIYGIISQRVNMMDDISGPGGTSTERVARDLRAMLGDPAVKSIVLDIDSPGGTVYGVEELANEIYRARGQKPIVAVANSLAASAAYWIATAADELVVTHGGEAGSVGVYSTHTDMSKWIEDEGMRVTLVSAGKFKTEGNPYEPLGAEARAAIQGRVDDYYGAFTRGVARNRGTTTATVRDGFGEGRVVGAADAVKMGMADRVGTFDETVARLAKGQGKSTAVAAQDWQTIAVATADADQTDAITLFNGITAEKLTDAQADQLRLWFTVDPAEASGGPEPQEQPVAASSDLELRRRRLALYQ